MAVGGVSSPERGKVVAELKNPMTWMAVWWPDSNRRSPEGERKLRV
jgi:hypothetical protein